MRKKAPLRLTKLIVLPLFIILALFSTVIFIGKAVCSADYFMVKEVIARGGKADNLAYLKGNNIFAIDLGRQAIYLLSLYPDSSCIRLIRVLPNRIFVDFLKRQPVAWVRLYRNFAIDENGFLFNCPQQEQDFDLPLVVGLETKIPSPKAGARYNFREVKLALDIIKYFRINRFMQDYQIKKIDVRIPGNGSFFLTTSALPAVLLEVRLAADNVRNRLDILSGILSAESKNFFKIKYIDLRFKEPLIKFNAQEE